MDKLSIDDKAIEFIKKALEKEKAPAMRLFISGGGCCKLFEIAPVRKALAGDITYVQCGVTMYVEKQIADNAGSIEIKFDEKKGLSIDFK